MSDVMDEEEQERAELEALGEEANAYVRAETAAFIKRMAAEVEEKFGWTGLTSAYFREGNDLNTDEDMTRDVG